MPQYIVSAVNPRGGKTTEEVEARTPLDAVRLFREQGYQNVVLESDDVSAVIAEQFAQVRTVQPVRQEVTPEDRVATRTLGRFGKLWFWSRRAYYRNRMLLAPALVFVAYRRVTGLPWGLWDLAAVGVMLLPLRLVLGAARSGPSSAYQRLIEAVAWYRYDEVPRLLRPLRDKIPVYEQALYEAQALAWQGRLNEALDILTPYNDAKTVPQWMYWSRLSSVYLAGGDAIHALDCQRTALERAPDNPALIIDLATSVIRFEQDPREAQRLLKSLNMEGVTDVMLAALRNAQGLISLEQGDGAGALQHFEAALTDAKRYAGNPIGAQQVDCLHAHLALAAARLGRMDEARQHFKRAEPRLRCFKSKDMLQRCEEALGAAGAR